MHVSVATIIEKTTNTATSVLHQLSLYLLKAIICEWAIESYNGLESWQRINVTTFQGGLRFQTGWISFRVSSRRDLILINDSIKYSNGMAITK